MTAPELETELEPTTRVLGCPDCEWTLSSVPGVDIEHLCEESADILSCTVCGWSYELVNDSRGARYTHALAEVHMTRPGH